MRGFGFGRQIQPQPRFPTGFGPTGHQPQPVIGGVRKPRLHRQIGPVGVIGFCFVVGGHPVLLVVADIRPPHVRTPQVREGFFKKRGPELLFHNGNCSGIAPQFPFGIVCCGITDGARDQSFSVIAPNVFGKGSGSAQGVEAVPVRVVFRFK